MPYEENIDIRELELDVNNPRIKRRTEIFQQKLKPGEKISVIIDQYQTDEKILYTSQDGKRVDFNTKELIKSFLEKIDNLTVLYITNTATNIRTIARNGKYFIILA